MIRDIAFQHEIGFERTEPATDDDDLTRFFRGLSVALLLSVPVWVGAAWAVIAILSNGAAAGATP